MKKKAPKLKLAQSFQKRETLLVNSKFQLQFLAWITGLTFLVISILYVANFYSFLKFEKLGVKLMLPQEPAMTQLFIGFCIVIMLVLATFGLIFKKVAHIFL